MDLSKEELQDPREVFQFDPRAAVFSLLLTVLFIWVMVIFAPAM